MMVTSYDQEEFSLLGHSLGGYLSALYSIKHPENIKQLFLASPVGLPDTPNEASYDEMIDRSPNLTKEVLIKSMFVLWHNNPSPFSFLRGLGYAGAHQVFKGWIKGRTTI